MVIVRWWQILLLCCFSTIGIGQVHAQSPSTEGFISIDCGVPAGNNYTDSVTKIPYTSDSGFIDTGDNYNISSAYGQESTLRSFAKGAPRNCYNVQPLEPGLKYLVRATFVYGNYDGDDTTSANPIVFDLHIGVNFWTKVNVENSSAVYSAEALIVPNKAFIWVCLVDIGSGAPFISSLEVRPLKRSMYPYVNQTNPPLGLLWRRDVGSAGKAVRYPDDPYDRIWDPWNEGRFPVPTPLTVTNYDNDLFLVPSAVMQTAVFVGVLGSDFNFSWPSGHNSDGAAYKYYMNIYYTEIDVNTDELNYSRGFDIFLNDVIWARSVTPFSMIVTPFSMIAACAYSPVPLDYADTYVVSMRISSGLGLPPIVTLSALEVYYVINLPELATDDDDVDAITAIKDKYELKKNWMGDPCAPKLYAWDGLICSYSDSELRRIIILNLSSSGLTGEISGSLANLKAITDLDLSNNSLTGNIPDFLAYLPSLKVLNLEDNQLNGSIPSALLQKYNNSQLVLSTCGNPNLRTEAGSCEKKKKKSSALIIVIASVISVFIVILVVFIFWIIRRARKQGSVSSTVLKPHNEDDVGVIVNRDDHIIRSESQVFTYKDLEKITHNFDQEIGRGGFGTVYHGYLENRTQVAVKMHSQSSQQGTKEFLSEAQLLTRVHHRNLVSLVGYCKDGNNLALVYEYMDQGSLHDHLRGKPSKNRALNWDERIRIALEAAQGLEYLHKGCSPPIIHRDVKTTNILLNQRFEAKLADFGLSKAFVSNEHTHISTVVRGTPGYLDPEYYKTYLLNEKSDVYSFGVVLLELITGKPALPEGLDKGHIMQWVRLRLARGDISDVADSRLHGEYDINSIWTVVDIAMKCTSETSFQRPMMTEVVTQLKESLDLVVSRQGPGDLYSRGFDTRATGVGSFEIAHFGQASVVGGPEAR